MDNARNGQWYADLGDETIRKVLVFRTLLFESHLCRTRDGSRQLGGRQIAANSAGRTQSRDVVTESLAERYFSALEFDFVLAVGEVVAVLNDATRIGKAGRFRALVCIRGVPQHFQATPPLAAFPSQRALHRYVFLSYRHGNPRQFMNTFMISDATGPKKLD